MQLKLESLGKKQQNGTVMVALFKEFEKFDSGDITAKVKVSKYNMKFAFLIETRTVETKILCWG